MIPNIYVINLKERTDKWRRMQVCLDNRGLSYERFDAIRLNNTKDTYSEYGDYKIRFGAYSKEPYYSGCYMSHAYIIKEALSLNLNGVIIMEDDVYPMRIDALDKLLHWFRVLPFDCELLTMEYKIYNRNCFSEYSDDFYKVSGGYWGTGCYYMSRLGLVRAYEGFISDRDNLSHKGIDNYYNRLFCGNLYATKDKLCYQACIRNDIKATNNAIRHIKGRDGRLIDTVNPQCLENFVYGF